MSPGDAPPIDSADSASVRKTHTAERMRNIFISRLLLLWVSPSAGLPRLAFHLRVDKQAPLEVRLAWVML
jgi:hypothetical protein